MTRLLHIGLLFQHEMGFFRDIIRGTVQYAQASSNWTLSILPPTRDAIEMLRSRGVAGVIAHVPDRSMEEALVGADVPVVNVAGIVTDAVPSRVAVDDEAVGRAAADYFLGRGHRNFGFVGYADYSFSGEREAGFRQAIESAEHHLSSYTDPGPPASISTPFVSLQDTVRPWLRHLELPAAVLASNDVLASSLAEICLQEGIRVPEDVSILGVDDDDLLCTLCRPSLSSIALPTKKIGYEAAVLLEGLIAGVDLPDRSVLLPPLDAVTRQSTDVSVIDDADVSSALRFISENAHRMICVRDVLRAVPVSRRLLERKFRARLKRGLAEEIRRVHVRLAKRLLCETDLPMAAVASRSGFSCANQLSVVFRQQAGETPTDYRRRVRNQPFANAQPVKAS